MLSTGRPRSNIIKQQYLTLIFACIILFVLTLKLSSPCLSRNSNLKKQDDASNCSVACINRVPPSIAQTLLHYASSSAPQTLKEMSVTASILETKSPCNFLVFGLGRDSLMWNTLNYGGRTVFLEEDEAWVTKMKQRFPMLECYHVKYGSRVNEADMLMEAGRGPDCTAVVDPRHTMCELALKGLPPQVYETQWDLIMVNAPSGYHEEAPGRMTAIYTAGMMARNREVGETHVVVHDVDRAVEDRFSKAFLCEGYMKKEDKALHNSQPPESECRGETFLPGVKLTPVSLVLFWSATSYK